MSPTQAKKLKKQTKKHQQRERGKRNTYLITVGAIIEASMQLVENNNQNGELPLDRKAQNQMNKVLKWTDKLLSDPNGRIGINACNTAVQLSKSARQTTVRYLGDKGTISGMAMMWIALSYICDEARHIAKKGYSSQLYNMNTLASTVSTWTDMLLEFIDESQEETAAELAEKLREIIIKES